MEAEEFLKSQAEKALVDYKIVAAILMKQQDAEIAALRVALMLLIQLSHGVTKGGIAWADASEWTEAWAEAEALFEPNEL